MEEIRSADRILIGKAERKIPRHKGRLILEWVLGSMWTGFI
jgi:hypothetical protein